MNPEYMKEIFHKTAFSTHEPLNLEVNENSLSNQIKKKLTTLSSRNSLTNGLHEI